MTTRTRVVPFTSGAASIAFLNTNTNYWKRRLAAMPPQPSVNQTWMAVNVVAPTPVPLTSGGVTVRIAGAAIELTPGFDPGMLRAVVTALAARPC